MFFLFQQKSYNSLFVFLSRRTDREGLVIITKIGLPTDPNTKNVCSIGLSRANVISSIERSLKNLQTNYIDFLQVDGWDHTVHIKTIIRVLDEMVMSGKVRNIGVCDFKGWQLQRMIDTSKYLNKNAFSCFQGEYNLLTRGGEMEVVDVCLNHDLGFIAFSPFKYGFLSSPSQYQPAVPTYQSTSESAFSTQMEEPFEIMRRNPCFQSVFSAIQNISNSRSELPYLILNHFVLCVYVCFVSFQRRPNVPNRFEMGLTEGLCLDCGRRRRQHPRARGSNEDFDRVPVD